MSAGKSFKSLTAVEPPSADVAHLEEQLSKLWRSAAEDPETEHPVVRACVLTLLVFVEDEPTGHETLQLVSKIIAQNPCRAIIAVAEPDARPEGLSAWISAQCHLPTPDAKQVCCEQICVRARGNAVEGLDSVVLPLTVPELPVYLWWKTTGFSPPKFMDQILRVTDRMVVDSARFHEPIPDLHNLAGQVQRFKGAEKIAFSDLNWARLTPCRELIAQCFDSAEANPCLQELAEVKLEWQQGKNANGGRLAQALLLTGWLASRLGWKPSSRIAKNENQTRTLEFDREGKRIRVECVTQPGAGERSTPISVTLKTGTNSPSQFSVIVSEERGTMHTRAELPGRPPIERAVHLISMEEVELLNEELKFPGRDRVYEEALGVIASMVEL